MLLTLYILFSVGLFIGTVVHVYYEFDNFYDTCQFLISDKLYLNITVNFYVAISIYIVNSFLTHFVGEFSETEMQLVFERLQSLVFQILFMILAIRTHVGMKEFVVIPIPLLLRYSEIYLNRKINSFSLSAIPPTSKQHQNIITSQVIIFFAFFYAIILLTKKFRESGDDFTLMSITQLIHGSSNSLQDIIKHILFLFDRHNNGNSQTSFRANFLTEIILQSFVVIFDVHFFIYISISSPFLLYNLKNLFDVVMQMIDKIKRYINFQRLRKMLKNKLPDATADDIQDESTCIICRNEMEPGKAKKLPCGHCFHVDCLERWVGQQIKCPTCQCDLTQIIDSIDTTRETTDIDDDIDNDNANATEKQKPGQHEEPAYSNNHDRYNDANINQANSNNISDAPIDQNNENNAINRINQMLGQLKIFERELLKLRDEIEQKQDQ